MSQTLTIARPYARAAFSLAHEHGRLAQWSAALRFAALAVSEPSVSSVLGDPRLESQSLVDVLPPGEADPCSAVRLGLASRREVLPEIAGCSTRCAPRTSMVRHLTSASALGETELRSCATHCASASVAKSKSPRRRLVDRQRGDRLPAM
jgi:F-type H+-transporting ATPase subunit delta